MDCRAPKRALEILSEDPRQQQQWRYLLRVPTSTLVLVLCDIIPIRLPLQLL
jgi:hypothetical protein